MSEFRKGEVIYVWDDDDCSGVYSRFYKNDDEGYFITEDSTVAHEFARKLNKVEQGIKEKRVVICACCKLIMHPAQACRVPNRDEGSTNCCVDCYDAVCDKEGYQP